MKEHGLSQLPVENNGEMVGSISEKIILEKLMDNPFNKDNKVQAVMSPAFPFVELNATANDISKLISKENAAVLVKENSGQTSIITKFDLIESMAG
jgi:cystathionine beta-synthase